VSILARGGKRGAMEGNGYDFSCAREMDGRMRMSVKVQDGNTVFHFFKCFFPVFYFSRSGEGNGVAGKNVTNHVPLPIYMAVSVSYSSSMVIFVFFFK
jgi:hypothetical protein